MNHFTRKTDAVFPLPVKIGGAALGLCSVFILLESVSFGIGALLLSVLILFTHFGVSLDLPNKKYKEFWELWGLKFGKWKTLPNLQRITITNEKLVYRNQSYNTGLSTYSTKSKTALNLRINDFEKIVVAKGAYNEMLQDALGLSGILNLEVLDATSEEKKIYNSKV